jgi:two-component system CheB/CheR fusion protein
LERLLERAILTEYAPACLVVDGQGEVHYCWGPAHRYLSVPSGVPTHAAMSLALPSVRPELRTALHKALSLREPLVHQDVAVETGSGVQRLDLVVRPFHEAGKDSDLYLVVFRDLGPPRSRDGNARPPGGEQDALVDQLESDLRSTRTHLQTAVEELEAANDELKSSNEELLSMNEEAQSSNEELQTSQEELRSVNEELQTVNAELLGKVEELDAAHADLQNLLQSTQIGTLFLDRQLRVARFTPAATEIFHLIDADVGRPITDLASRIPGLDLGAAVTEVIRDLVPHEETVRLGDGPTWYLMRILPYRATDGSVGGATLTFTDVTAIKQAEEALRQSEERERERTAELAAVMDAVPASIRIARDRHGGEVSGNRAAYAQLRMEPGRNLSFSAPDGPRHFGVWKDGRKLPPEETALYRAGREGTEIRDWEEDVVFDDGASIHLVGNVRPLRGPDGKPEGAVAAFLDITDRKRAEDAIRDASQRKDEFLAVLGHELRNPLSAIQHALELARSPGVAPEEAARMHGIMQRQLAQLGRMVDDLLDVTRISKGKVHLRIEPVELRALVAEMAEAQRPMLSGVELDTEAPRPVWVDGDRARLAQVLSNLLSNATRFTPPSGRIGIALRQEGPAAVLVVEDTGTGIDQAAREHLFEPFAQGQTRSAGGLGLGLALVKALVEMQRGSVSASSPEPGLGARFEIRLPARGEPPGAARAEGRPPVRPRRILIIEDGEDVADALGSLLSLAGHSVEVAGDGPSGIEKALALRPEIVLCDLGLPGKVDGYGVARALRAEEALRGTALVALSGYAGEEDRRRALEAGFAEHLQKPMELDALQSVFDRLAP